MCFLSFILTYDAKLNIIYIIENFIRKNFFNNALFSRLDLNKMLQNIAFKHLVAFLNLIDQLLIITSQHARREILHHLHVVGGHDYGVALFSESMKKTHYLIAGLGIKITRGLVGEYKLGTIKQCAGYYDTLLLASAQFMGHLIAFVFHPHFFENLLDSVVDLIAVFPSCGLKHKPEIGQSRSVLEKLKVLKDYSDFPSQVRYFLSLDVQHIIAEHFGPLASGKRDIGIHRLEERTFSAAHFPDEIAEFTLGDVECNILHNQSVGSIYLDILIINNNIHIII